MKRISFLYIILSLLIVTGCVENFGTKQNYEPPHEEALYLIVGQTTMADVTKVLNPTQVVNYGSTTMMRTYLYHQNAILYIHIDDRGTQYTQTLNLAALSGYFNHIITLDFFNGVLVRYDIS